MTTEQAEETMIVAEVICKRRGYTLELIQAKQEGRKKGKQEFTYTKQLIHYFVKNKFPGIPLSIIGWKFGFRDHATVLHSIRVVNNSIEVDRACRTEIQILELRINEALAVHRENGKAEKEMVIIRSARHKQTALEDNGYRVSTA